MESVLIAAAGSGVSWQMINRLKIVWGDEVRVIAVDTNPRHLVAASLIADEFAQVPPSSSPDYGAVIADLLCRHEVTRCYPMVSEDFRVFEILSCEPRLSFCDFVMPANEVQAAYDKLYLFKILHASSFPIPDTLNVNCSCLDEIKGDRLFVKPRSGFGSKGARLILKSELLGMGDRDKLVIQSPCGAPEITVDFYHDWHRGHYLGVCRERLEVKSGVCTKARVFIDDELNELGAALARRFGIHGGFCFQVMWHGRWVIVDVNFRLGAGTAISCAVGADFFAASHAARMGLDGMKYLNVALLRNRRSCYVVRQYCEFLTQAQ